jgi:hypothetical protein
MVYLNDSRNHIVKLIPTNIKAHPIVRRRSLETQSLFVVNEAKERHRSPIVGTATFLTHVYCVCSKLYAAGVHSFSGFIHSTISYKAD